MKLGLIAQGAIQKFINVINDYSFSCKKRGENTATLKATLHWKKHISLHTLLLLQQRIMNFKSISSLLLLPFY